MKTRRHIPFAIALAIAAVLGWWGREAILPTHPKPPELVARADPAPTPGDRMFDEITANWTAEQFGLCQEPLRDVLGTRDLVQSALDAVNDPRGKAANEVADAKHWIGLADTKLAEFRPRLVAGDCAGDVGTGLEQATQYLVNAGTAAVQAAHIAGSR
jgi:hypothetical protein